MKIVSFKKFSKSSGKDSLLTIIGQRMGENNKVLVINNTKNSDLDNYFLVDTKYKIDNLKPYIESEKISKELILELCEKLENNLYYLSSKNTTLNDNEILIIKKYLIDSFDFILIDSESEVADITIEIKMPTEKKEGKEKENLISIINFWNEGYEIKKSKEDVYVPFDPEMVNFINGKKGDFSKEFEDGIVKIVEKITNETVLLKEKEKFSIKKFIRRIS